MEAVAETAPAPGHAESTSVDDADDEGMEPDDGSERPRSEREPRRRRRRGRGRRARVVDETDSEGSEGSLRPAEAEEAREASSLQRVSGSSRPVDAGEESSEGEDASEEEAISTPRERERERERRRRRRRSRRGRERDGERLDAPVAAAHEAGEGGEGDEEGDAESSSERAGSVIGRGLLGAARRLPPLRSLGRLRRAGSRSDEPELVEAEPELVEAESEVVHDEPQADVAEAAKGRVDGARAESAHREAEESMDAAESAVEGREGRERRRRRRRRGRGRGADRDAREGEPRESEARGRSRSPFGEDDFDDVDELDDFEGLDELDDLEAVEDLDEADDEFARETPGRRGRRDRRGRGRSRRERTERDEPSTEPRPPRRIFVNAMDQEEVRIGILEEGRLEELFYERPADKKYLGNIYKGRIVNIEPGIQAAFVDIGIGRNGFLHVSDVLPIYKEADAIPIDRLSRREERRRFLIQEILRKGQEVLVQISKDSIGMKGPSLTTYISIPGKFLVLMPGVSRHGVSKRIQGYEERAELRRKLRELDPPEGVGYIVRTAGKEDAHDSLDKDFRYLMGIWESVCMGVRTRKAPCLLFQEHDLVTRALRDLFGSEVEEILIDEAEVYEQAKRFLLDVMPQAAKRLKHYSGPAPLFSKFGIESQIERIYNRRIPLPSGGWINIEQTEALVAIDVNSGKYRDEENLEATALHTNLEAAKEICRQLRLRDLGGVIVIDFIDMEQPPNRRELERALKSHLKKDKAKSWITRVSRFGIIEMTRQRVRPSFESSHHIPCPSCSGSGWIKAPRSIGISILRRLQGELPIKRRAICEVTAYPSVLEYLVNDRRETLVELEASTGKRIVVRADASRSPEDYTIKYP